MSSAPSLVELSNTLLCRVQTPPTIIKLESDYESLASTWRKEDPELTSRQVLKRFLRNASQEVLTLFNLVELGSLVLHLEQEVQVKGLLPEMDMFDSEFDNLTPEDVVKSVQALYRAMRELQLLREQGHRLLSVLKQLQGHLELFRNALVTFVQSEDLEPRMFQHLSERTRFVEPYVTDIKAVIDVLSRLKGRTVSVLEETIPSRNNLLMRTESSIRLICKVNETDGFINRGNSQNHTTPAETSTPVWRPRGYPSPMPTIGSDEGFAIEAASP